MEGDRAYICRLIDIYGGALSERRRDMVDLYYNRRTVAELYALEASLGIYAKSERVMALAAEILACGDIAKAHRLAEQITGEL